MLERYQPNSDQPWNVQRVVHLHRRAGFGADWNEIQRDLKAGPEAALNRIFSYEAPNDKESESANNTFEQMSLVICDAAVSSSDIKRLKAWWLYRMLFSRNPLTERLVLMWHNHFATSNVKVANVGLMRQQNAIFRQFARSRFDELLTRAARDPALLLWLDADVNRKEHPNENMAREIMELFTLGVGNYSERDVKEAARALTGWGVNKDKFRTYGQYHDDGEKTIFGNSGTWTGDDLLRLLGSHESTAKRLAFRLCEQLMGENGDAGDPNQESKGRSALIHELANGLRERDLDIGWGLETVLRSEEFFAEENIRNRVLGPVEYMLGAINALELSNPPPSTLLLAEAAARLGQDLFYPPNVFGWQGGRAWLTSRSIVGRANFAVSLVSGEFHRFVKPFDATQLAASHGFMKSEDIGTFFAQLLLGLPELPVRFESYMDNPKRLVAAVLASPEAQIA